MMGTVADTCTLGVKLKAQIAQREAERLTREQQASDQALAAARRHKAAIRDAFEEAKGTVAAMITGGHVLKPIKLPDEFECSRMYGVTIDRPNHPDHHLFLEFMPWAEENGLRPKLSYQHDGGGMTSWHELSFEPL